MYDVLYLRLLASDWLSLEHTRSRRPSLVVGRHVVINLEWRISGW